MSHIERLKASGTDLWRNPSVMGVMVLQYLLASLLVILCIVTDLAVVAGMNKVALGPLLAQEASPEAFVYALWNTPTIVVVVILVIIQLAILTFVSAMFTAGAYGMIKNLLLDGTTTFREFVPEARRYTGKIFRFALLRFAILIIPIALFALAVVSVLGTTPGLVTGGQYAFLFSALGLLLGVGLIASLLLIYGDAVIVFEDIGALAAAKRTFALVRKRPGVTIATALLAFGVMLLLIIIVMVLSIPLQPAAGSSPSLGRVMSAQAADIVGNVLLLATSLLITIFIFRTYRFITDGVVRTTPYSRRKKKA